MLEFQEEFFYPEIREGFYVDATMKTVWAAEMEVVQTIAEICGRYELTWYAGFGTLLGAIRHEGFVPWDDDMDLMMPRADYMKLLEVMPQELPKGYLLKSPMVGEGYVEYHTTLFSGEGISIEPEHLKQFHNCPFAVGVDIFPLDHLPDDKGKLERQKALFTIAGRVNQMARNLLGGFEIDQNDTANTTDAYIAELKEGIKKLQQNWGARFDDRLIRNKQWESIITWAWKTANQIAMEYETENVKLVAMYGDFITWEHKVYPKEWFQETYAALYEGFMIPIPNGYEEILKTVYGDWLVRVKSSGMHEYPFYIRQLRQLRRMVKERSGQQTEMEKITPADWRQRIEGKKVILYESGLSLYSEYGAKALDKLENNFKLFELNHDAIALWWRPQTQMRTMLSLISMELVERYDKIFSEYKAASWGICDETDDLDRAIEYCNGFYGEMSSAARAARDKGVPVLIEQMV